jgi:hypothetical protein
MLGVMIPQYVCGATSDGNGWLSFPRATVGAMVAQLRDLSDERLRGGCVFCDDGDEATRDHVPSRVFLDQPFPDNLPVVPACAACNNGFSLDEQYLACLIDCVIAGSTDPERIHRDQVRRTLARDPKLRERLERARREEGNRTIFVPEGVRVRNVIVKLARGHAAYELGTPRRRDPDSVRCAVLGEMAEAEAAPFYAPHTHYLFGEVGCRASQRMMILEATCASPTGEQVRVPLFCTMWVDVQDGRYRYQAVEDEEGVTIRSVFGEYLATEVRWFADTE